MNREISGNSKEKIDGDIKAVYPDICLKLQKLKELEDTDQETSTSLHHSGVTKMPKNFIITSWFTAFLLVSSAISGYATTLVDAVKHNDVVYFLLDSPAEIARYDLASNTFLPSIGLNDSPKTFCIDTEGIYISYGRYITHLSLDGTSETTLKNAAADVTMMFTWDNYLIYHFKESYNSSVYSINKTTGATIDSADYSYEMSGWSVAPTLQTVFARSVGVSPSDIVQFTFNADGTLNTQTNSPYHGDYPDAVKTFIYPDEGLVFDTAGIIYNSANLTYSNSLAGSFNDITFYVDISIVLRSGTLFSYSNTFAETGTFTPPVGLKRIFYHNDYIYGFYIDGTSKLALNKIPIVNLTTEQPGQPIDPTTLRYTPDDTYVSPDGIIYLFSAANRSVFRWSIADNNYLESISLLQAPNHMTYSEATNTLYFAYESGKIKQIQLNNSLTEIPFVNSPQTPCGLATAGQYVFVCDPSGSWVSHFTYKPDGSLISQKDWNYYSTEYVWSEVNRKIYFFRDDTSPNDLLWEDIDANGSIGDKKDSPYHNGAGFIHPIHVAPDGSVVLLGSGKIYNALSLEVIDTLANDITDASWVGEKIYTLRPDQGITKMQEWGETFLQEDSVKLPGNEGKLFNYNGLLTIMIVKNGIPSFYQWNPAQPRIDSDSDGYLDSFDSCPLDPQKLEAGICGCGLQDIDSDNDGVPDCNDECPYNQFKIVPNENGCNMVLGDINGDNRVGLEEAIHALQVVSGKASQ